MSNGGGGKGSAQTTGYLYSFGIHMGIGRGPVDELVEIKVGDKTAWTGSVTANQDVAIDQYNLFGGEAKEGGVQGTLQVMMGESTQTASSGLVAMLGGALPGFRRMVTVFFDGIVAMNNPYPKKWSFRVRRAIKGWDGAVFEPALARIGMGGENALAPGDYQSVLVLAAAVRNGPLDTSNNAPSALNSINTVSPNVVYYGEFGIRSAMRYVNYINATAPGDTGYLNDTGIPCWPDAAGHYLLTTAINGSTIEYVFEFVNQIGAVVFVIVGDMDAGVQRIRVGTSIGAITNSFTGNIYLDAVHVTFFSDHVKVTHLQSLFDFTITCSGTSVRTLRASNVRTVCVTNSNDPPNNPYALLMFYRAYRTVGNDAPIMGMNPAHIIYECLTNREWGRGLNSSMLDTSSFTECANTLFSEKFGLCLKWSRRDSIDSFVQSVIDHIGATIFTSRTTGLITLRLIRGGYVESSLPMFDSESGLLGIQDAAVTAPGSGVNQVIVTYHDPLTDEDRVARVDNLAAIQAASGGINSIKKDYPGIPVPALALRVAQRDLRAGSLSLRRFNITLDRRGRMVEPGSVIRIRDASRGIPETVVRVGRVDDGTLTSGKITITGIQDVFALPTTAFTTDVPNTWAPPSATPCLDVHKAFELPYFLIAHNTSAADLAYIDPSAGYVGTLVARGQAMNVGYKIAVRDSAPTSEDFPIGAGSYCGFVPDWTP